MGGASNDMDIESTAHHEAGHIVVAAVQRLRLLPQGLGVDPQGEGLACYFKQPDASDLSVVGQFERFSD